MSLTIPAKKLFWLLMAIAIFFVLVGSLGDYSELFLEDDPLRPLRAFAFSRGNLPTWYASAAFLADAGLLLAIALHHWQARSLAAAAPWAILAMIFLALSANEIFAVEHSTLLNYAVRFFWRLTGLGYFATQIVVAGLGGLLLVVLYFRVFSSLPAATKLGFFVAGLVFFGGAIGLETLSMMIYRQAGGPSPLYMIMSNLEEFAEVAGVLILFYTLLQYIQSRIGPVKLTVN
ncbi:MAG: hypothetical protein JXN59_07475 [Anaerolineae bacterium]|nr:hypothetical protein [Anaerolineae bacterium]